MTTMCPHCGYNLEADRPLVSGDWALTPSRVSYLGKTAAITAGEAALLYSIAKASGEPVSTEALLNRVSDSDNPNTVAVMVARLRIKLPRIPFETVRGSGYRWTGERPQMAAAA